MTALPLYIEHTELLGDLETPVSIYLKLDQPNSFLLESVTGGDQVGRYSIIGMDPFVTIHSDGATTTVTDETGTHTHDTNPLEVLESVIKRYDLKTPSPIDRFSGGAVGFFAWDVIKHIEHIPSPDKPGSPIPLLQFMIPRSAVVFDHVLRKITLMAFYTEGKKSEATTTIDTLKATLQSPIQHPPIDATVPDRDSLFDTVTPNMSPDEFKDKVSTAKHHIHEGDIFQIVLSQKFSTPANKAPFDVYRKLRYVNPSPYMFYMNFGDYQLIGSSPEILVKKDDKHAVVRPLAGTRPRIPGREDELIEDLLADEKERAEHLMLVDLGRNDLGRVCEYDTVETTDLMTIEKYSHVMHISSNVVGKVQPDKSAFDVLKATFPAGTLSGTPKIRAMQIIEQLEPEDRGPYGGALGHIDFNDNMDLCIIIRTILSHNKTFTVQAGAGIVADSDPESEHQECRNKARGALSACI